VDGHDHVFLGHIRRKEADDFGIDLELLKIDVGIAEMFAEDFGQFLFADEAQVTMAEAVDRPFFL
jgi:hypothetical protein